MKIQIFRLFLYFGIFLGNIIGFIIYTKWINLFIALISLIGIVISIITIKKKFREDHINNTVK
ncbi:hypothetical protein SAMN02799616_00098 [Paenibacillus sp. UNC499MF]|nr:hypothetical protein SAMN02799616_00098 [Paenibacillus sp. UNC499MF]